MKSLRFGLLALVVASCGPPPGPRDEMSSATLDHQDPKADTSHHPVIKRYGSGSWWRNFHPFGLGTGTPDAFSNAGSPPHYYTGCGGCSSDDPANLLVLLALASVARRRRTRR